MSKYSANYKRAFGAIIGVEGGYSNDPHDPGGETMYGISRVYHPGEWENGRPTIEQGYRFYWREFWNKWKCDEWDDFFVAVFFFAGAVHGGGDEVSEWYQRAYNDLRYAKNAPLKVDGVAGPKTRKAINRLCSRDEHCMAFKARACAEASNDYIFSSKYKRGFNKRIWELIELILRAERL